MARQGHESGNTWPMSDRSDEVDDRATSVPLPTEDGDQMIAQQNVGPESEEGSGEWPSTRREPTAPAPGITPEGTQAASRRDQSPPAPPSTGSASQPDQQQDASTAGDRGPARSPSDRTESFKDALGADPISGGSQSAPAEDDQVETTPG